MILHDVDRSFFQFRSLNVFLLNSNSFSQTQLLKVQLVFVNTRYLMENTIYARGNSLKSIDIPFYWPNVIGGNILAYLTYNITTHY